MPPEAREPFPPLRVHAREQRHRRMLLIAIASLILVSLTPVVGRHLVDAIHRPLLGIDHVGALCLVALHLLLVPVHAVLHWLVAGGALLAIASRVHLAWRAHRTLRPLDAAPPLADDSFSRAARLAGLNPRRLRIVEGLPAPAFTAGWFHPIVYVARSLGEGAGRLEPEELAAVLAHERAHVVRLDPLRLSLMRALADMLFWLPALRALFQDMADEAEIRADDAATTRVEPLVLASAILTLASWRSSSRWNVDGSIEGYGVGFLRPSLVARRVQRLSGEDVTPVSRVTRRSVAAAGLALAFVWTAGVVDVHALPGAPGGHAAHEVHCEHPGESAMTHLFCRWGARGGWFVAGGLDCPHRSIAAGAAGR